MFGGFVIVVDDGSKDKTYILYSTEIALEIGKKTKANLKVIQCLDNGGKGSAVKFGVLSCEGEYILFADANNNNNKFIFSKFISRSKKVF